MRLSNQRDGAFSVSLALILAFAGLPACSSSDSKDKTPSGSQNADGGSNGTDSGADDAPLPVLPEALEECPTLATGTMNILGQPVNLFVGERQEDKKGPILFYWHGTYSQPEEANAFMQKQIDEIVAEGGMVASFGGTQGTGEYTGPFVWYLDDFKMTDQLVACAVKQLNIDTRRIYSAGCSAGGLQTGTMAYERSSYVAGVMTISGGIGNLRQFQDESHIPNVISSHGAPGKDVVILDFSGTSTLFDGDIVAHGGFAVDCNHGGGHCGTPQDIIAAQWQFLKDHPFGVHPEPYASGLPSSFPSTCQIYTPTDGG
ncbi:MAG TPA: hypothetical protein VHE30_12705 [Polyangiaceae bacterium]|nr:hypothetical protein [Polyangiaceae bacterium]